MIAVAAFLLLVWVLVHGTKSMPSTFEQAPTPTVTATSTAVSTATAAPTTTSLSPPTPAPRRVRVTWYGEAFRGGPLYCGGRVYIPYSPDDPTTVAMGADGPPCGTVMLLCSDSACIVAVIKDKCGGCGNGHLDLSHAGWEALGRPYYVEMTILDRSAP